jgi:amidophosphoribosyltransferase
MLLQLQHRGQLSAGISTFNSERKQLLNTYKKLGTVNEVFKAYNHEKTKKLLNKYSGTAGIGHVRYATLGGEGIALAHPFERHHGRKWKWFAFAVNGNIANYLPLKKKLEKKQYHLPRDSDTELLLHYISKELVGSKKTEIIKVFSNLSRLFDGSYNLTYINAEGQVAAVRDPWGIRPICYAEDNEKILVASESCALVNLTNSPIKTLRPGHILVVKNNKCRVKRFAKKKKTAHCMFEWVYFANPSSIIDRSSVYQTRYRMGRELAKREFLNTNDPSMIVVCVPDTSKPIADSYAFYSGVRNQEGLLRNRYVGRTFIEGQKRSEKVREKFFLNKPILKGKKVILIEDSIVRGTTTKELIKYIKKEGKAKEVHVRFGAPPIRSPCFYGIDMSSVRELIAARNQTSNKNIKPPFKELTRKELEKIRKEIGADTLMYQRVDSLIKAIHLPKKDLCLACLTGVYPTPEGRKLRKKAVHSFSCGRKRKKRTYE